MRRCGRINGVVAALPCSGPSSRRRGWQGRVGTPTSSPPLPSPQGRARAAPHRKPSAGPSGRGIFASCVMPRSVRTSCTCMAQATCRDKSAGLPTQVIWCACIWANMQPASAAGGRRHGRSTQTFLRRNCLFRSLAGSLASQPTSEERHLDGSPNCTGLGHTVHITPCTVIIAS